MNKEKLEKILKAVEDLPTIPSVVAQLMATINDDKSSAKNVSAIASMDQSITMKLLKLVNSAYYGLSQKIASVDRAITLLGFDNVRTIILSLSVFDVLNYENGIYSREMFWGHSVGCAVICKMITQKLRLKNIEGLAFVTGLLHDIGKVIEDKFFSEEYKQIIRTSAAFNQTISESEKQIIGYDHGFIGSKISEKWQLPNEISETILYHHNVPINIDKLTFNGKLLSIIHFSDIIAKIKKFGSGGDNTIPELSQDLWKILKISEADLQNILNESDKEFEKAQVIIDLALGKEN